MNLFYGVDWRRSCCFLFHSSCTRGSRPMVPRRLPATLRRLAASNFRERENVDGNEKDQQVRQPQKICSKEELQQEKIEHEEIRPESFQKRGAGDEGVQARKAEERIGPKGDQPEASRRDWTIGSQKIRSQSSEEKIAQFKIVPLSVHYLQLSAPIRKNYCSGSVRNSLLRDSRHHPRKLSAARFIQKPSLSCIL
jgi:hypothetical protein